MSEEKVQHEDVSTTWASRWLTARNLALTTAFTVLVSAGVTAGLGYVTSRATAGPGVEVSLITNPDDIPAFGPPIPMVLPRSVTRPGSPGPGCAGFHQWAKSLGGMDEGTTRLQVIVRGTDEGQVVINAMRVVVEDRRAPPDGTRVECPTAGDVLQRRVSIDLDAPRPVVKYDASNGRPFGFTVGKGEVESFLVTARTTEHSVRWRLVLDLVVGGDARSVDVAGDEPSFTTTAAPAGEPSWQWDFDSTWHSEDGRSVESGKPFPGSAS